MTIVKSKEIVFRVPVFFREKKNKKKTEHFSKYINIKIEIKIYSPLKETVALMPSYINLNFLTSFKV